MFKSEDPLKKNQLKIMGGICKDQSTSTSTSDIDDMMEE
jgi:hypothetical protein